MSGTSYELINVSLPHQSLALLQAYQHFFEAPILINQARAILHLSNKTLACTPHSTNLALHEMARDYLNPYLHSPNEMMNAPVKKALSIHPALFRSNRVIFQNMLALHPQTVKRKLEQEGDDLRYH